MQELFKIIIDYAKDYPILIPFVVFGFFYVKNAQFRKFFNKTLLKILKISFSNQLFAHDLFFQRKLWEIQIKRVRFQSEHKTKLFRILLSEKVHAVLSVTEESIKRNLKNIRKMHPSELSALLLEIVYSIIETYEKAIRDKYMSEYGAEKGVELYNLIYKEHFKPRHEINVQAIERKIARLPFSASKNTDDIFRSFLSKIQDATEDAIDDCVESFAQINGRIEEIIRKA